MKSYKKFFVILLLNLTFFSFQAQAKTAIQAFDKLLTPLQTMQANFTQVMKGQDGAVLQESNGKMWLVRPGRFRWQTLSPNAQLIVIHDKTVWIYDKDLAQVTIKKMTDSLSSSPALLLSGSMQDVTKYFIVKKAKKTGKGQWFDLLPKAKNAAFERLSLHFMRQKLITMVLLDSLGQTTELSFKKVKINKRIDKKQFNFKPPAGVDIIKE